MSAEVREKAQERLDELKLSRQDHFIPVQHPEEMLAELWSRIAAQLMLLSGQSDPAQYAASDVPMLTASASTGGKRESETFLNSSLDALGEAAQAVSLTGRAQAVLLAGRYVPDYARYPFPVDDAAWPGSSLSSPAQALPNMVVQPALPTEAVSEMVVSAPAVEAGVPSVAAASGKRKSTRAAAAAATHAPAPSAAAAPVPGVERKSTRAAENQSDDDDDDGGSDDDDEFNMVPVRFVNAAEAFANAAEYLSLEYMPAGPPLIPYAEDPDDKSGPVAPRKRKRRSGSLDTRAKKRAPPKESTSKKLAGDLELKVVKVVWTKEGPPKRSSRLQNVRDSAAEDASSSSAAAASGANLKRKSTTGAQPDGKRKKSALSSSATANATGEAVAASLPRSLQST